MPAIAWDALHVRIREAHGSFNDRFDSKYGEAYVEAMALLTVRMPI